MKRLARVLRWPGYCAQRSGAERVPGQRVVSSFAFKLQAMLTAVHRVVFATDQENAYVQVPNYEDI
jgi:hypothetical protein